MSGSKAPDLMPTDCSVLRTPTILASFYFSSQGQEILPVMALAAATAGLAR